jgi:hypothetical protein
MRSLTSASGLRLIHSYISAFVAPTIVFFAISGALQIVRLNDAHGTYQPNALITAMAQLHKDQVLAPVVERGAPRPAKHGKAAPPPMRLDTILLKALFITAALALVVTTLIGSWIGATHPKRARTFRIVLAAGVVVPVLLIVF